MAELNRTQSAQQENGIYFGYPKCCIEAFINRKYLNEHTDEQRQAADGTGFIPCQNHSLQILAGDIKIADLISNRQCEFPFPQENPMSSPEELKALLQEKFEEYESNYAEFKADVLEMPFYKGIEYFKCIESALDAAMFLKDSVIDSATISTAENRKQPTATIHLSVDNKKAEQQEK